MKQRVVCIQSFIYNQFINYKKKKTGDRTKSVYRLHTSLYKTERGRVPRLRQGLGMANQRVVVETNVRSVARLQRLLRRRKEIRDSGWRTSESLWRQIVEALHGCSIYRLKSSYFFFFLGVLFYMEYD